MMLQPIKGSMSLMNLKTPFRPTITPKLTPMMEYEIAFPLSYLMT